MTMLIPHLWVSLTWGLSACGVTGGGQCQGAASTSNLENMHIVGQMCEAGKSEDPQEMSMDAAEAAALGV